ncbi:P-loop NTPase fold protein [Saccharolobus shibatae]|uniref:KAP NTPase domain-containing protein n=1 Tax=Saccharolobus shibatae TaxID=2286 RepID=A0A8F5C0R4_9CREN|nr:P-loop NTPase fold protein [Saccharolobus shibatae]QXJ34932.1 hypothetical protein J5U22_01479 [Saccharolobus shibatae]
MNRPVNLAGSIWNNAVRKIESSIRSGEDVVITIIGEPGSGKTTILNKVKLDLSKKDSSNQERDNIFIIFLDLTNSRNISSKAWNFLKNTVIKEKIATASFNLLSSHKKEIGYSTFNFREFSNWLRHKCEDRAKGKKGLEEKGIILTL